MWPSPTGQQHVLRWGDDEAVVVEVGGGLRRYACAGRDILDGYTVDQMPDGARGQLLAPWPNRVRGGRYRWDGREFQLALTEPRAGNAIHGLLRWTSFAARVRDESRVVLGATLWPQPGYPFHLDIAVAYRLGAGGLSVSITARNVDTEPAPYGVGQHPYFTVGTDRVDDALLTVPAAHWLRVDEVGTPVATETVAGSAYDFRTERAVEEMRLDSAYTGLSRDASGHAVVRLRHPSKRRGVDVWLGSGTDYVQLYTGDTLVDAGRRRRGIAIEPMSCPPNAFRNGVGLVTLAPGQQHVQEWGVHAWSAP